MKKSTFISFLFLGLTVYCFTWAEGLECYDCIYIDSDDLPEDIKDLLDESCQEGKTPNENLLRTCQPDQVCGKYYARQSIPPLGSAEISARACADRVDDLFRKCVNDKTPTELSRYQEQTLSGFLMLIPVNEIPTVCTSDSNDFNQA